MSKASDYIKTNTRKCSNEIMPRLCEPWLTPDNALRAVEIAREEVIEKACDYLRKNLCNYFDSTRDEYDGFIDGFRKAMEE